MESISTLKLWRSVLNETFKQEDRFFHSGRRFTSGLQVDLPGLPESIPWEDMGYSPMKESQLRRIYWPSSIPERVGKFNKLVRGNTLAFSMAGGNKLPQSKGYCMQGFTATPYPKGVRIDVFYRKTELCQKFLADLVFIGKVFGELEFKQPVELIRLHVAQAYVSPLYFIVAVKLLGYPIISNLRRNDFAFYKSCMKLMLRYEKNPPEAYNFGARKKMGLLYTGLPLELRERIIHRGRRDGLWTD